MKRNNLWMTVALVALMGLACLPLAACRDTGFAAAGAESPAKVEPLEGAEPTRLTLTEDAAKRLDLQTEAVADVTVNGAQRQAIPYGAVLYDTEGKAWTYINTEPLTYVRHPIVVDRIEGDQAILSEDLTPGSEVVKVGAQELFGAESEFAEE